MDDEDDNKAVILIPTGIDPAEAARNQFLRMQMDYGLKFFTFHAKQRMSMFNYFLLATGLLVKACTDLLNKPDTVALLFVSGFGFVITVMFLCLERRNEELVHISEDVLRAVEQRVLFKDLKYKVQWPKQRDVCGFMRDQERREVDLGIFRRQDYDHTHSAVTPYAHGKYLPWLIVMIGLMYVVFFILGLSSMGVFCPYKWWS